MQRSAVGLGLVLLSLLAACGSGTMPPPPGGVCMLAGMTHEAGDSFPSPDGCNTCSCTIGGQIICTLRACVDASLPPCRRTGCSGQICADQDVITTCEVRPAYACYARAACERQADGRCAFTPTPELAKCLDAAP